MLGLLGGIAMIAGVFLPWMKVAPTGIAALTISGWDLTDDAKIILAIGVVAIVLSVIVIGGQGRGFVRLLLAIAGIATLGLAAFESYDILKRVPKRPDMMALFPGGAEITGPALGLILILAAGVLLIIASLAMKPKRVAASGFTAPNPG